MKKYTPEQKLEVLKFFEDGCTVQEIFEASKIPKGTLYRWKSELCKPGASGTESSALEARVALLEVQLEEALEYINRLKRQDAKRRESYEDQDAPVRRLVLGKKP